MRLLADFRRDRTPGLCRIQRYVGFPAVSLALLAVAIGGHAASGAAVSVVFAPAQGSLSDTVAVRLTGLAPGSRITVTADTAVAGQWRSLEMRRATGDRVPETRLRAGAAQKRLRRPGIKVTS
jgi:hypothetical protein